MKRNTVKLIALLLMAVMAVTMMGSALAATHDELYTIQLFSPNAIKLSKWSDTPIGKVVLEKFNFDIELVPAPAGDTKELLGLMLAAGNYPEIVELQDQDIANKYISAGALLPLDPYLDQMPNFTEWYKDSIPFWRWAAGDGNLYNWNIQIPQDQAVFPENNDVMVRSDLLEQQGWKLPVSTDEWVEFLKVAKENNPTTPDGETTIGMVAPFGESWGMAGIAPILYEKGVGIQIANGAIFYDTAKDGFVDMFTHPDTKESFHFFNRLYNEGLLDEESFTDKAAQIETKISSGRALSAWYVVWYGGLGNNSMEERGWENMMYITAPIQGVGQIERGEKNVIMTQLTRPFYTIAITKNAKHPERLVEILDFFSSVEGQLLMQSGIEGVHYNVVDGKRVATDAYIDGAQNVTDYGLLQGFGVGSLFGLAESTSPVDGQPFNIGRTESVIARTRPERIKQVYENLGWEQPLSWWLENAKWQTVGAASGIALDQQSDEGVLEAKLADFRVKNSAALIMAADDAAFEALYAQLVEEYNKMQPELVVNKYNELYAAANEDVDKYR